MSDDAKYIKSLRTDQVPYWKTLAVGHRQALLYNVRRLDTEFESGYTLSNILGQWEWQCPTGELRARCSATGHKFTGTGLMAPRVFRINPEELYDHENITLVCQAYWRLRTMARMFGAEGHTKVAEWAIEAAEWFKAHPDPDFKLPMPNTMGTIVPDNMELPTYPDMEKGQEG